MVIENNSKWIKDLTTKAKTIKLLEKKIGQKLHDIAFGNDLLAMTLKAYATKVKIDKLDSIKIKNFCTSKDIIKSEKTTY